MEGNGFFYCPRCSCRSAVWQNDFSNDDVGYDREGLVTFYTCSKCGSEIEVFTPEDDEE